ncbi:hypothetical protein [Streptomyces longhuiensis]|uniref:hypothetical protein n=1 Tax=Streptomyces longhuiensis TaxID=2880933 RepID=UPI001D0A5F86|nr:hypothetical protein [Streptomyces longhuiensis]UDM00080.1 hypothetical protein LGI35_18230 [Streptomyces longhuiensis]
MARLWTCGFELQSAAAGVEILSVTGAPTVSTTVHRLGTASLRINPSAATQYVEQQVDTGVVKRSLHRLYLRITTLPSATVTVYAIGQSGYFPAQLRLTATGTLRLYDAFTGTDLGTASAALSVGQWYRIELDHTDAAGTAGSVTGAFVGYLNGANFSGSTLVSNINGFSRIRTGFVTAATGEIHLDDLAVNDTTGTAQTGLPGPGNVVHLVPDSAGDANGWATAVGGTAGAANNWGRVSETPPNDGTSYNETSATGTTTIDDFNVSSPASAGLGVTDAIALVSVGGRIGSNATIAANLVYRLKSQAGGTVVESGSVSIAVNGWATHKSAMPYVPQLTAYTNPQTGAAWTRAALDNAQIGVRSNVNQASTRRVSALWALVEAIAPTSLAGGTCGESAAAQTLGRRKTLALGTATETDVAQPLVAIGGIGFATLADDFNDGVTSPAKWPDSYESGGYSETGGRARIACTTAYNAYASAEAYRLRESHVHVRMWPPAAGGATAEAWSQLLVQTATPGTDAVFEVSAVTGNLVMAVRTGYYDPAQVAITYDPVAHAWLRIRETGGSLFWDTSPDGITWTNRRAATSPVWVGDTNLQVQLIAHRDGGTNDYAEFDAVNSTASQQLGLSPAVEAGTAQPLGRVKVAALPRPAESAAVQALPRGKRRSAGIASGVEAAQPLARAKRKALGVAVDATAAQWLARIKRIPLALAAAKSDARPLGKAKRQNLATASETSTAGTFTGSTGLVSAQETTTAQPLGRHKASVLGTAGMVETARPLGRVKRVGLGVAAEIGEGRPLMGGQTRALVPAEETWTARLLGRARARALLTAGETHAPRPLTGGKARALSFAIEASTAWPLAGAKRLKLTAAEETDQAQAVAIPDRINAADETSTACTLHLSKARTLGASLGVDPARALSARKHRALGVAIETSAGLGLARGRRRPLSTATAVDEGLQVGSVARLLLGTAVEVSRALIGPFVRLTPAVEVATAELVSGVRQRPADRLDVTTFGPHLDGARSGPELVSATAGPSLAASTTSPHLTATSTGG